MTRSERISLSNDQRGVIPLMGTNRTGDDDYPSDDHGKRAVMEMCSPRAVLYKIIMFELLYIVVLSETDAGAGDPRRFGIRACGRESATASLP